MGHLVLTGLIISLNVVCCVARRICSCVGLTITGCRISSNDILFNELLFNEVSFNEVSFNDVCIKLSNVCNILLIALFSDVDSMDD